MKTITDYALTCRSRIGRRPTLLVGSTLMATWLFANAGILATYGEYPGPNGVDNIREASTRVTGAASRAVIACSYLFVASFAPTWGPVSWIYPPELCKSTCRQEGYSRYVESTWSHGLRASTHYVQHVLTITYRSESSQK